MRIGILTHPQGVNYGGIIQCYALYTYLTEQGHECVVIHKAPNPPSFFEVWKGRFFRLFHFKIFNRQESSDKTKNIRPFVASHLKHTRQYSAGEDFSKVCSEYELDAVIVGSDQVWRQDFAMNYGYNYFLDFVGNTIKKIAYAASFGLSQWHYSDKQTKIIKELVNRFDSISVREEEGVVLCDKFLGVKAEHVLDPSLLLSVEDYSKICSPRLIEQKYIFVYWLGDQIEMESVLGECFDSISRKVVTVNLRDNKEQVSIGTWLSYLRYAECVMTDSFHGCALSVVFNRPFRVFTNTSGGQGRIKSLFLNLGIEGNSVSANDYQRINKRLEIMRDRSLNFLNKSLG